MVYVSCNEGKAIDVFSGFADGTIEKIQAIPLSGRGLPIAVSPDRRKLYASVIGEKDGEEEDHIDAFTIDPASGKLAHLSTTIIDVRMAHISVDRTGQFLLGASFPSHKVAVYPIGPRGQVQEKPTCWRDSPLNAHQILIDPSNRFCFVSCLGGHQVMQLVFDQNTGKFTDNNPATIQLQTGAGCRQVAFHPDRRFVYLLNERDGTMVEYALDQDRGTLSEIGRDSYIKPDLQGEPWGAQIHVCPLGRRLFASDRRGKTLACWRLNADDGKMANRQIVDCGGNPRGFDITPKGDFLILGAMDEDMLEIFDISEMDEAPRLVSRVPTSSQPGWVEIV